jgi:hypothetical protein
MVANIIKTLRKHIVEEKYTWNPLIKHNLTLWLTNITETLEKFKSENNMLF